MEQLGRPSPERLGHYLPEVAPYLEPALREQARTAGDAGAPDRRLGDILLALNAVSREQLRAGIEAQRIDRLRRCALFAGFSREDLVRLSPAFEELTVRAGTVFITQDSLESHLYVVAAGALDVFRTDPDGEEVPLAVLGEGEPVGEMGYLSRGPRTASVRARGRCELLCTSYATLRRLLDERPRLASAFLGVVAQRLAETSRRYEAGHQRLRRVEHTLEQLGEFLDLSEVAAVGAGIEGLLERLVDSASTLTGAERASLFLLDPTTGELWSKYAHGAEVREIRLPSRSGVAGWVVEQRRLANIPDAYADPRFNPDVDRATGYRTRTILCAPIWGLDREVMGVVQVVNKRGAAFGEPDERLIKAFAHQAAVAVENYRLHRRMIASHHRMATLLDVAGSVADTLDLPRLVRTIVARATEALQCERSSFFVVDDASGELWSMETHGAEMREIRFPLGVGLAGHCARSGETLAIRDAYQDPRFNREVDRETGFHTRSVLCVPVINRDGRTTGVIQCINRRVGDFDGEDERLARAIAAQISVALDNARLHSREVDMRRYLERVHESIASAILTLDDDWRVVVNNRAAERLLPALGDDDAPCDLRVVLGDRNPRVRAVVERAYATRTGARADGMLLHRSDDDFSTVDLRALPLEDAEGEFKGIVVVLEDVTRERRVRHAFSRYLSPAVIDRLLEDPDRLALGGEQRVVTAMFTDIEGFTSVSEQVDPSQLVGLLNEYFDVACAIVFEHGGTIDKIVGDSLHVLFNAPLDQPDHAAQAVRCALALEHATRGLVARRAREGVALGRTRIGVNTGRCVVGNFGGETRFDYTAHGDSINTAARLEGANKYVGTAICVSASTARECTDLRFRPIARLLLNGKREPIEVFEPLTAADAATARVAAYRDAYARMAAGAGDARTAFLRLVDNYPGDGLVCLHAGRLARGERGDVVELAGK